MFYVQEPDKFLRLGDVVRGYISTNPTIKEPNLSSKSEGYDYKIEIGMPKYSVVLTPCCNIEKGKISLSPLIKIKSYFLLNPYFAEDLTRINRRMTAQQSLKPEEWEKFDEEEKQRRLAEKINFALLEYFVYKENEIFDEYSIRDQMTRYYMVDMRNIYTIKCPMVRRPEELRPKDAPIIESKVLQLSVPTRSELRDKIAYYYSRPAEEDILED